MFVRLVLFEVGVESGVVLRIVAVVFGLSSRREVTIAAQVHMSVLSIEYNSERNSLRQVAYLEIGPRVVSPSMVESVLRR